MSPTKLEVENLAKSYGGVPLFSGLTFLVETGLTDQVLDDPREAYTQLLVASILPP